MNHPRARKDCEGSPHVGGATGVGISNEAPESKKDHAGSPLVGGFRSREHSGLATAI